MMTGKNQSGQAPTAFGSMLQACTHGMAIPVIYGRTISPALVTWANNLRQGGSTKKFKQLKKGITAYCENITLLIGKNPILGTLQFFVNNGKYPLNFLTVSNAGTSPFVLENKGVLGYQIGSFTVNGATDQPDPNFYAVIGVTKTESYSQTFNDYGGPGLVTVSGNYERPMWNELVSGPDPTGNSGFHNFPLAYRWQPGYGPYIFIDFPDFVTDVFTVYYAQLSSATLPDTPLSKLRLHWEARLGDGDEYDGNIQGTSTPLSAEQIIYDDYAGVGSASIDLGSSGAIPAITPEVQGKFGLYSSGDCDFVDIIEDILKSGITQAALGSSVGFGATQHGVGCFDYPGCIQAKVNASVESFTQGAQTYNLPVTAGNYLIAIGTTQGLDPAPVSITDSGANTWTPLFSTANEQAWYAVANASGVLTVTVTGLGHDWHTGLFEVAGVDTIDSISIGSNATGVASVTTADASGSTGYLLSVALFSSDGSGESALNWKNITPATIYGGSAAQGFGLQGRVVYVPGTYSITIPTASLEAHCIISFKGSSPPNYPKPGGDFLDQPSADLTRLQCRAAGLWGSLSMNSQKAASEWISDLVTAANCAPVYSGFRLKLIPRSEVSAVGNGAVYIAPTASGPVADLDADKGDFIGDPISAPRAARTDLDTVLQMQHLNRNSDYQQVVTAEADPAGIALYGTRKKDPIVNNAIQDVAVAQPILRIMVRRRNYVDPLTYKFKLNARWGLLEAMDLVTITDRQQGIFKVPVRLKSVEEDDQFENDCEAEPFIYGISAPQTIAVTNPTSYRPTSPGSQVGSGINPPIIFEATPRLAQQTSPAQIWCAVSCPDPNYGGCIPYISTDGGLSYHPASETPMMGSAAMGRVLTDWPAAVDPDTANDLSVNLSESLQSLVNYSATQRDKFQFPAFVGYANVASATASFTVGDPAQITELDVLFSNPTILNALPADAVIVNIFPVIQLNSLGPADPTATINAYCGTGLTPTSGGTVMLTTTSPSYVYYVPGIGTSLTGQAIRYALNLAASGGAATTGKIGGIGWAINYTSATPTVDPTFIAPFDNVPNPGEGWGWAVPGTVTLDQVGTGTNASIVANGAVPPPGIPYELISYNTAALVGVNLWTISATGTGNEIHRGVYGAPAAATGMDHPPGSKFVLLDPGETGLVKINMDPAWIDTQLWFKFLTFNAFGGSLQSPDDADAYPFTPTGIPGNIGPAQGFLVNGA